MLAGFVAGDCGERPAAYCIIDLVNSRKERGTDRKMRREIKAKLLALTLALSMALGGAAIPCETLAIQGTESDSGEEMALEKSSSCTVTFNTGGGNPIAGQTVNAGGYAKEPTAVYRNGYDFTGWYKEAECVNRWDFYEDTVEQDVNIYAGWAEEWSVESLRFIPASDTVRMSQIEERDNDGIQALNLANRGNRSSGNQNFFLEGDSCTVKYNDGTEKKFTYSKKRGVSYAVFKANDGSVIYIEVLATELSKEVRAAGEGSADELAAAIGANELTVEYRDNDIGRYVRAGFSLTVEDDEGHDCTSALRTCNACAAGCENTGFTAECKRCQICNKYYSDDEAKNEISRESVLIPALGHACDEGTVIEEPAESGEGKIKYACTREGCRVTHTETIGQEGHSYSEEWSGNESSHWHDCTEEDCGSRDGFGWHMWMLQTTPASCTGAGEKCYVCAICGAKEEGTSREYDYAAGHSFGEWADVKAPTELAGGLRQRSCTVCGFTETEATAALAPSLKAVKILKPKPGKISATVRWKKISKKDRKRIKKVEIQCSTDRTFTENVKTSMASAGKVSKKIKGLHNGKVYYVRVRARNGDHISAWSKVKKVKPR